MYHDYIEHHLTNLVLNSVKSNSEACKYYYQTKARFYLDEYPEQVELRKNWFKKITDTYFERRWLRRN